jgi:hypothetical protein
MLRKVEFRRFEAEGNSMKILSCMTVAACVTALAGFVTTSSEAAVAYDFTPGGSTLTGNQTSGDYALGCAFTVNSPIFVTGLRVFDGGSDGVGTGLQVLIYSVGYLPDGVTINSGALIASASFAGTSQSYDANTGTRYQSISSVQLNAGTYLVVANRMGTGADASEVNYNAGAAGGGTAITTDDGGGLVTFGNNYYNDLQPTFASVAWSGSQEDWHLDSAAYTPLYAAGNFDFTAVPEAHHFAMAGAGLMGLVYFGRCAMQRRKVRA